jgi:D-aspartate ligase
MGDVTLVRPLGWAGVPVVAVTTDPDDVVRRCRYVVETYLVPGYGAEARARTVESLCALGDRLVATHGRIPLFYGQDPQLEVLYQSRAELERRFSFVLNDDDVAWSLLDKRRFSALCERAGVPVPRTVAGDDRALPARLADVPPPLLVKPRVKTHWRGIQQALFEGRGKACTFANASELMAHPAFESMKDQVIIQELVDAPLDDLRSFHGFAAANGSVLASFCGRKLRTSPRFAGESAFIEVVTDPEVEAFGVDVVRRLGLKGPFKIDVIRNPRTGAWLVLEVNARFTLWNHVGAAAGVNLMAVAYDQLVAGVGPSEAPIARPGVRWLHLERDLREWLKERGLGVWSLVTWAASVSSGPLVQDIFDLRDPAPFVSWVAGQVGARLKGLVAWPATA